MKNKIVIGISVLLIGFLLGGVSFYLLGKITGQQKGLYPSFSQCPQTDR